MTRATAYSAPGEPRRRVPPARSPVAVAVVPAGPAAGGPRTTAPPRAPPPPTVGGSAAPCAGRGPPRGSELNICCPSCRSVYSICSVARRTVASREPSKALVAGGVVDAALARATRASCSASSFLSDASRRSRSSGVNVSSTYVSKSIRWALLSAKASWTGRFDLWQQTGQVPLLAHHGDMQPRQ